MRSKVQSAILSIQDNSSESRTLDYKRQEYGRDDKSVHELLKDVSAFANTIGGQIILGVDDGGIELSISGIHVDDLDNEILRMTQLVRSGIEPHLETQIEAFEYSGRQLILLTIPSSHLAPHRIKLNKRSDFYYRTNTMAEAMDIYQIREAFLRSKGLYDSVRQFTDSRLMAIKNSEGPLRIQEGPKIISHICPLDAETGITFTDPGSFPQEIVLKYTGYDSILPRNFNVFGACYSHDNWSNKLSSYVQIFRNGAFEVNHSAKNANVAEITENEIELRLIQPVYDCFKYIEDLCPAPYVVQFSLLGFQDLKVRSRVWRPSEQVFGLDLIKTPAVILDHLPVDVHEFRRHLKGSMDLLMQSAGFEKSNGLSEYGRWLFSPA